MITRVRTSSASMRVVCTRCGNILCRAARVAAAIACAGALLGAAAPGAAQEGISQWKHVRPGNTGIPGIQLHFGTIAPDGRIWVAGRWPFWGEGGYGIYDIQNDTWETLSNFDTPQPSQWARQVLFDGDIVWMATDDGLARKQGDHWTIYTTSNSPLLHNKIRSIALAPDGRLWINNSGVNTNNAALFSFEPPPGGGPGGTWVRYRVGEQIPFAAPWYQLGALVITPDGHIWIGNDTLNGAAEFDGASWTLRGDTVGRFGSGQVDSSGDLWFLAGIGGGNQFWRYRRQMNQWDQFSPANTPFANTTITRLAKDTLGRIHAGNWMGQVIRFDGASWSLVADVGDAVYGISVHPATEDLWIVTLGNGRSGELHHLDPGGNAIRRFNTWNTGAPDYFVDGFNVDRRGNLWLATGEAGLSRLEGNVQEGGRWRNWGAHNSGSEPYPFAGNEPMGAYYEDRQGRGWMGGNGIALWNPDTGAFSGFWNWQNNPGMGVTLFTSFAEDAAGALFAATQYGSVMRFDAAAGGGAGLWMPQPPTPGGYTSSYAGVKADNIGRIWAIGRFNAFLWDDQSWTQVGQQWDLFGKGGANVYDLAPDGTLYIGTNEGLLQIIDPPGGPYTLFTPANSPLPAKQVQGIDVRQDGLIALSSHLFQATTPFPTGVAVIDGDIADPANWAIYRYGQDPIPHYQLGPVKWDAYENLWISAVSEGCAVLLASNSTCYANCDGSTVEPILNVDDFTCFINEFATAQSLPHAQQLTHYANCDGSIVAPVLNVDDFTCFINRFAEGCP